MNLARIIDMIVLEETRLNNELSKENEQFKKIEKVIEENNFTTIKGLLNLNTIDVITAYLCINSTRYTFDEIKEKVEKNIMLINPSVYFVFTELCSVMSYPFLSIVYNKMLSEITKDCISFDYRSLKELYDDNQTDLESIFTLMSAIEEMKADANELKDYSNRFDINDRRKTRIIGNAINDEYNIKRMTNFLNRITIYYQNTKSQIKEEKKKIKVELGNYQTLRDLLNKNQISNITKLLSLIKSDEIKKELLYQHSILQKKEFDTLYGEYFNLSLDNKLEVQAIFKDYGFDFTGLSSSVINKILVINRDDLKLLLDKIKTLNITDMKLVEYILLNSSCKILDSINSLIKDNILTLEFVNSNPSIFSADNNVKNNYFKLISMLEFFKSEGINTRIFITDLDIYFNKDSIIKANITILRQYNLFSNIKSAKVFGFLTDDNLIKKIDILLELGYEKLLEDNLEILNRSINKIQKLYILKSMGLLPVDMESLIKVLDDDKFLAFIDNPNDYITNVVDYHVDKTLVDKVERINSFDLDNNDNTTSRVISIGGVLFSKNRIRKNRQILDSFDLTKDEKELNSILIGSVLSEEEYEEVIKEIKEKVKTIKI